MEQRSNGAGSKGYCCLKAPRRFHEKGNERSDILDSRNAGAGVTVEMTW